MIRLLLAACFVLVSTAADAAPTGTMVFAGSLADDRTGDELHGDYTLAFELYTQAEAGAMVWSETHEVTVDSGRVELTLGTRTTLDPEMLADAAYLSIKIDGVAMSPRLALASVPYAMRASVAEDARTIGGIAASDLQQRVRGTCTTAQFMRGVRDDGSVECAPPPPVVPGAGVHVDADGLRLDTGYTDSRYVRKDGDAVTGTFRMAGDAVVNGNLQMTADQSPEVGPEIHWYGNRGAWVTGIDVANNGGSRDFVLAGKVTRAPYSVEDFVYISHNGERAPALGVGVTPPNHPYRLQVSGPDQEPEMGSIFVRKSTHLTGDLFAVVDAAGTKRWWLDAAYWLQGASNATQASVSIKASTQSHRALMLARPDGTSQFSFEYNADATGRDARTLQLKSYPTGVTNVVLHPSGKTALPNGVRIGQTPVPSSATSACTKGDITYDSDHVYVCVATNTWRRSALEAW